MIEFLLSQSPLSGITFTILFVVIVGHLIYTGFYKLVKQHIEKRHERIGRTMFRTSAGLLAFIISLNYANYRLSYLQIQESLESEAAQLVDIYIDLGMFNTESSLAIRGDVEAYIQTIIDHEWKHVSDKPFTSESMVLFMNMNRGIHDLVPENERQKIIKNSLISDLDEASDFMQVRVYKTQVKFPYLLYIVLVGMILVYCFYSVYTPDKISIIFLALYNIFIAVIVYFVIMMSNPLVGPIKIEPEPFKIIMEKGINEVKKLNR